MKPGVLIASAAAHGLLYLLLPSQWRSRPPPTIPSVFTPVELIVLREAAPAPSPAATTPRPSPTPPLAPSAAATPGRPPRETSPKVRPPRVSTKPSRARPDSTPRPGRAPGDPSAADSGDTAEPRPRRLDVRLTNASERPAGPGASTPAAATRSAAPPDAGCTEPLVRPKAVQRVAIEYTPAARAQRLEGQLVLRAVVAPDGRVRDVSVVRSVGDAIDRPARKALMAWRFEPATRCGEPTVGHFTVARTFELDR